MGVAAEQPRVSVDLTSEMVDRLLEESRLEIEKELASAGPLAVQTLSAVMQDPEARDSDRISAASKVLDKVMAPPKAEAPEQRGPTVHVTVNMLSTGERQALPIAVSEAVMDAIEAGTSALDA